MFEDAIVFEVKKSNIELNKQIDTLLHKEGIKRDKFLDYTSALTDDNGKVVATGSLYKNTMRCLAVDSDYQGHGLIAKIVTHLADKEFERGNYHYFGYTKPSAAPSFLPLGFYEIARIDNKLVFMENKKNGFSSYLSELKKYKTPGVSSAIVMNANPFTLGHLHLVKTAAENSDAVHLFILSEDESVFPSDVRLMLVKEGTKHLKNVIVHTTGPYMISTATFPSYFLKDDSEVTTVHSKLDIEMFSKIASVLNITRRYVAEEPFSKTTDIYNDTMKEELPKKGIELKIIPRLSINNKIISASFIRECIKNGSIGEIKPYVPETTYSFLQSKNALPIIEKIQNKQ